MVFLKLGYHNKKILNYKAIFQKFSKNFKIFKRIKKKTNIIVCVFKYKNINPNCKKESKLQTKWFFCKIF